MRQDDGTVQAAAGDPCGRPVCGTVSVMEGGRASERTKDAFVSTEQGNEGFLPGNGSLWKQHVFGSSRANRAATRFCLQRPSRFSSRLLDPVFLSYLLSLAFDADKTTQIHCPV